MRFKSYMLTSIALLLGIFTIPFLITLPIGLILATIGLVYGVINIIKHHNKNELIINILAIIFSVLTIIWLIYIIYVIYDLAIIQNVALITL